MKNNMKCIKFVLCLILAIFMVNNTTETATSQERELSYRLLLTIENATQLSQIVWSPDGKKIAVVDYNRPFPLIKVWNASSGDILFIFEPPSLFVYNTDIVLAWHPDGELLASGYEAFDMDFVHIWDTGTGDLNIIEGTDRVTDITWSPDGTRLALTHGHIDTKTTSIWSVDGSFIGYLEPAPAATFSAVWVDNIIVTADQYSYRHVLELSHVWQIWDAESREELFRLNDIALTETIAAYNNTVWGIRCPMMYECEVIAWQADIDKILVYEKPGFSFQHTTSLAYNSKQDLLAYNGNGVMFWKINGQYVGNLEDGIYVEAFSWSSDGTMIATTHPEGGIKIWKIN